MVQAMKTSITLMLLLASVAYAQPDYSNMAPKWGSYQDICQSAVDQKKPLVVFCDCKARAIIGVITSYRENVPEVQGRPSIMVYIPDGAGWLQAGRRLGPDADNAKIGETINLMRQRQVSRAATPFVPSGRQAEAADDDQDAAGPWPESITFMKGIRRYRPARYTQRIAVTDNRDSITPVPRSQLEAKWQVPGGLVGLTGWKSDLRRYIPEGGVQGIANIAVWNGSSFQNNRGHVRRYPTGTVFMDILSNTETGKVFEHRIAEKNEDGTWERYVAFRDPEQRPLGYVPLKSHQCASCHAEAGTGGYATGLVPGGDTVLSDEFGDLERSGNRMFGR
jgi:hypothetical protein